MLNKKQEFEPTLIALADFAKVISHPARIAILNTLAARQTCICGELVEVLPLAQSTVSQHLKELKSMGLITGEIDGVKSCYCINWAQMTHFITLFNQQLDAWQQCHASGCTTC
jgi:ArsR family transcriptional regulator, arsenate/arsenite/antimonite-responsive transcriptional repressor